MVDNDKWYSCRLPIDERSSLTRARRGAALGLITCSFPMLPITLMFTQQTKRMYHQALWQQTAVAIFFGGLLILILYIFLNILTALAQAFIAAQACR
jgi:hypothetical protein